jgi:lipopolysaccharide biosynthesis glycosyltransferase
MQILSLFFFAIFALLLNGCKPSLVQPLAELEDHHTQGPMNVVFAANNLSYLEGAGVSIFSILTHAEPDDFYKFYIYTTENLALNGLPHDEIEAFNTLEEEFRKIATIEVIPLKKLPFPNGINPLSWGEAGLLRLLLPELLPSASKVLYLDCDMLALKNIKPIYQSLHPNDPQIISAVLDIMHNLHAKNIRSLYDMIAFPDNTYVNSGLLVMNLDKLRAEDFSQKTLRWLATNDAGLPDQDVMNVLYYQQIKTLPFSYAWPLAEDHYNFPENTLMLQYIGDIKPWKPQANSSSAHLIDLYKKYREASPWANLPLIKP